jgi:hypothetical protein
MLTEHRLAENKALIRSLNQRVAVISETLDTFGSLKFMCECGIYACRKRIELTASAFEAIRSEPTHFLVHPDHVLYALEIVVLEFAGSHVVVEERPSGQPLRAEAPSLLAPSVGGNDGQLDTQKSAETTDGTSESPDERAVAVRPT